MLLAGSLSALAGAPSETVTAAEWQRLRDELRKQGYPVASRVESPKEIASDMERVRQEMERRQGKPFVSDIQRVGGGGGPVVTKPTAHKGLSIGKLENKRRL